MLNKTQLKVVLFVVVVIGYWQVDWSSWRSQTIPVSNEVSH